jgi:hypothetical protein
VEGRVVEAPAAGVAAVAATAKTDMACLFRADLGRLGGPNVKATRMFLCAALDATACAAFFKKSRMKCGGATKLHRKSGGSTTIAFAESPQIGFWNTHSGGRRLLRHCFMERKVSTRQEERPPRERRRLVEKSALRLLRSSPLWPLRTRD